MFQKKGRSVKLLGIILALVMVMSTLLSMTVSVSADTTSADTSVTNVSTSLLQVQVVYDKDGDKTRVQGGTGFLINSNTVLTCEHVVSVDDDTEKSLKDLIGSSYNNDNIKIQVIVSDDVAVEATVRKSSSKLDFAVLNLTETISRRNIVALGDSSTAEKTQQVYALGFPASVTDVEDNSTFTSEDVTITEGKISKLVENNSVAYIQHSATLSSGNSGGPLVDSMGNVIGINNSSHREGNYFYSTEINQIKSILDQLSIEYTSSDSATVATEASTGDREESTVSTEAATTAPTEPEEITEPSTQANEQGSVDTAKVIIIVAIVALAVILIVIVILIVVNSKKKNNKKVPAQTIPTMPQSGSMPPTPPVPPMQPRQPVPPMQPRPTVSQQPRQSFVPPTQQGAAPTSFNPEGAGETSVLNEGAGETTVLGFQQTGAYLVRKSSQEKIYINKPDFTIGKERRRVDYCITNNNSVSRAHARIKTRAGQYYIADLGSTNGTFINGNRLSPNQEVALGKGDKLKIADEEFEFQS